MNLVTLPSSRCEAGIAGNGSSEVTSSSGNSSKHSKIDQPKPISCRTRSTYAKRRRPQGQPPTDGDHTPEALPPSHRQDVFSTVEALQQGGGATASKPLASQFEADDATPEIGLRQTTNSVSSSDDGVGFHHHREAPVPSPAASTPLPAEWPTQNFGVRYLPAASGGNCGGGSARKKSRLSLNRRRRPLMLSPLGSTSTSSSSSSVVGAGGSNLGLRGVHDSATHGSPWRPSPQQRRQPPCLSSPATPPPGGDRLAAREDSADTLAGGALTSMPPSCSLPPPPPPPLPPFVGLENLGETCYVNAVVQALVACFEALMLGGMSASARAGREDATGTPCSVPCVGGEDIVVEAATAARGGGGEGDTAGSIGGDENHVLETLGNLLEALKERNHALSALASGGNGLPQLVAPQAFTAPSLSRDVATHSETLRPPVVGGGGETAAMLQTRRLGEPPPRAPDFPRNVGLCTKAINPIALVDLIREGWLSAGRGSGGGKPVRERNRGRLGDCSASAGFGSGQQCASELLGKLLDLTPGAAAAAATGGVPSRGEAAACKNRGRGVNDSTSGLIDAFRGVLSACTACVECERDRATREEFTELTLPPLVPQHPPPSPYRVSQMASAASDAAAANDHSLSERLTLEGLVDSVLGSETLDGNSKVWCEACNQWTEAKRHFSIHSAPRLLALHVRPATGGQPICPPPPPAVGGSVGVRGSGPRKARGRAADGSEKGEGLIERVLVVKRAARSGFHETAGEGAAALCRSRTSTTTCTSVGTQEGARGQENRALGELGDSEDVRYELVGIILHKGQTLGFGHYTFARHTGATSRSVGESSPQRPPHCSSALGVGAGEEGIVPPPREAGAGSLESEAESVSAAATEGVHGSVGEGAGGIGIGCSTNKHAFALFDDACVRWLSPKEERDVFRGGGSGGGLGEAFLVFYARRP